jgi:hypothetical protein
MLSPSTSTGFRKPNFFMLAAICLICFLECVRGLRGLGRRAPMGDPFDVRQMRQAGPIPPSLTRKLDWVLSSRGASVKVSQPSTIGTFAAKKIRHEFEQFSGASTGFVYSRRFQRGRPFHCKSRPDILLPLRLCHVRAFYLSIERLRPRSSTSIMSCSGKWRTGSRGSIEAVSNR